MIFGLSWKDDKGAAAFVTVDGQPASRPTFLTETGIGQRGQLLYMLDGLDPAQEHTVSVTYDSARFSGDSTLRRFLVIDSVIVNEATQSSPTTPYVPMIVVPGRDLPTLQRPDTSSFEHQPVRQHPCRVQHVLPDTVEHRPHRAPCDSPWRARSIALCVHHASQTTAA